MVATNKRFSLADQREVFFSSGDVSDAVRYAVRTGKARQLGPRLYTKNVTSTPQAVCLRNWTEISAGYFPGAVIVGRTAMDFKPAADGSVFLVAATTRDVRLPGLRLRPRHGADPLDSDQTFFGHDIYMSSRPRAFLENAQPSRARGGAASRTLSRGELEEALERYGRNDPASLNRLRDEARNVAPQLGLVEELKTLDGLIGTLLGTQDVKLSSARARAIASGVPYDPVRIERLEQLATQLLATGLPEIAEHGGHDVSVFAFFESYFSNYIEGTEFSLDEAADIALRGLARPDRPADAHDIAGTYQLVNDPDEMRRLPRDAQDLLDLLQHRHQVLMRGRPGARPGAWKTRDNRAGSTVFVAAEAVPGTLRAGFGSYSALSDPFARAVFLMFFLSEVHPFVDGNGRVARVFMNAELVAARQVRVIVPTVYRNNYLAALRAASRTGHHDAVHRTLAFARRFTARVDFSSRSAAEQDLVRAHALLDADEAERDGLRLQLP